MQLRGSYRWPLLRRRLRAGWRSTSVVREGSLQHRKGSRRLQVQVKHPSHFTNRGSAARLALRRLVFRGQLTRSETNHSLFQPVMVELLRRFLAGNQIEFGRWLIGEDVMRGAAAHGRHDDPATPEFSQQGSTARHRPRGCPSAVAWTRVPDRSAPSAQSALLQPRCSRPPATPSRPTCSR